MTFENGDLSGKEVVDIIQESSGEAERNVEPWRLEEFEPYDPHSDEEEDEEVEKGSKKTPTLVSGSFCFWGSICSLILRESLSGRACGCEPAGRVASENHRRPHLLSPGCGGQAGSASR